MNVCDFLFFVTEQPKSMHTAIKLKIIPPLTPIVVYKRVPPTAKIDTSVVDLTSAVTEVDTESTLVTCMFSSVTVEPVDCCVSSSAGGRNVPGTVPLNLSEKVITVIST